MSARAGRRRKAYELLGAMLFLVAATSFHSAADNDFARFGGETRLAHPAALPAPDSCAACALDGLSSVRGALPAPVGIPAAAESVAMPVPVSPFVAPRASIDSRPPPAAA
ncbi:MAG TPA: hypothetical protein VG777_01080 [Thermoanaerobaculia bacterium]|nr:hypothetical protein [Thermoanaerobaculia bacterium]